MIVRRGAALLAAALAAGVLAGCGSDKPEPTPLKAYSAEESLHARSGRRTSAA